MSTPCVIQRESSRSVGSTRPRGLRNNNPLNIRINPRNHWHGKLINNTDGVFEQFNTIEDGCRAACVLLANYYLRLKLNTISLIVRRWAPPTENNTDAYIQAVCRRTGYGGQEKLTKDMLLPVIQAMACVEIGDTHAATIYEKLKKAYEDNILSSYKLALPGSDTPMLHQRQNKSRS